MENIALLTKTFFGKYSKYSKTNNEIESSEIAS